MNHIGNRLDAFVAGELDPDEQLQLTRHLAECAACTARVVEARVQWDLLGRVAELQPQGQARPSMWPQIQARTTAQRNRRWIGVAVATAALAAGMGLAILVPAQPGSDTMAAISETSTWGSSFWLEDQTETTFSDLWLAAVDDGSGS